jgi:hypothetical protein
MAFSVGKSITTDLNPKQVVPFEELLMSQVVQQEALTRLLIEKGIFTKEEFLEMVEELDCQARIKSLLSMDLWNRGVEDLGSGNRNKVFFLSFLCRVFFQPLFMIYPLSPLL